MDKVETYIGFCIKKGSVVFGLDNVKRYRKKMYIVVATQSVSPKTLANTEHFCRERNIQLVVVPDYDLLAKRNCKVLGICDKSLADAIVANI